MPNATTWQRFPARVRTALQHGLVDFSDRPRGMTPSTIGGTYSSPSTCGSVSHPHAHDFVHFCIKSARDPTDRSASRCSLPYRSTMALNSEQTLTAISREEDVARFAQVIVAAFSNDALNRYLFLGRESRPDHPKLSQPDLRVEFWLPLITTRHKGGGILVQTYDYAAVALWLPPGTKKPVPSGPVSEGAAEYREKFDAMKQKYLGDRPHWYLNLIGRSPSRREKGAVRGVMEPFLQKAREQNVPVWLEATNRHARDVYAYFGFQVAEEVRIGQGVVNADGWAQQGGEGVLLWGMMIEASKV
ncbi:hypothetical protein PV04_00263 [Phialophora macrospora]|uniref:N-acetyltransferase domain-containing protein n=1 Tax=Phialophora macrospora TaxID=1851006 RepID=A0A0D2GI88_9EURO|nr:hypothetical protein PV04_00263 [Phialophora macrospora]